MSLVVAQFAVSIGLIICTAVVYAQTVYARTVDPGLPPRRPDPDRESRPPPACRAGRRDRSSEIERVPGVTSVGRSGIGVATQNNNNTGVQRPRPDRAGQYRHLLGSTAISSRRWGSSWSPAGCSTRTARPTTRPCPSRPRPAAQRGLVARGGINIVINELAARRMGFRNPARRGRQDGQRRLRRPGRRPASRPGSSAWSAIRASARSASRSIRSCSGSIATYAGDLLLRYDTADPRRRMHARRAGLEAARPRRAVRRRVQRGQGRRALRRRKRRGRRCSPASRCSR